MCRANALVGALHRRGVLTRQHQPGALAVFEDRQNIAQQQILAQLNDRVFFPDAAAQYVVQRQLRAEFLQRAAEQVAGRHAQ
ncbi:hypothetical protein D3C76_1528520 [compost metagenome]